MEQGDVHYFPNEGDLYDVSDEDKGEGNDSSIVSEKNKHWKLDQASGGRNYFGNFLDADNGDAASESSGLE